MALNDTILNIGAAAMQAAATHLQIHTAEPSAAGSNEATSARQVITWETAANGDMVATVDLAFTGGASSGPATHVGFWSALTVGTFYGWLPMAGGSDLTFNAAGEYTLTGISIPGTAT